MTTVLVCHCLRPRRRLQRCRNDHGRRQCVCDYIDPNTASATINPLHVSKQPTPPKPRHEPAPPDSRRRALNPSHPRLTQSWHVSRNRSGTRTRIPAGGTVWNAAKAVAVRPEGRNHVGQALPDAYENQMSTLSSAFSMHGSAVQSQSRGKRPNTTFLHPAQRRDVRCPLTLIHASRETVLIMPVHESPASRGNNQPHQQETMAVTTASTSHPATISAAGPILYSTLRSRLSARTNVSHLWENSERANRRRAPATSPDPVT